MTYDGSPVISSNYWWDEGMVNSSWMKPIMSSVTMTMPLSTWTVSVPIEPAPLKYGWTCPRCEKIWGPHIAGCTCNPVKDDPGGG